MDHRYRFVTFKAVWCQLRWPCVFRFEYLWTDRMFWTIACVLLWHRIYLCTKITGFSVLTPTNYFVALSHFRDPNKFQHRGFGQLLMEKAEEIARNEHMSVKIAVISGVGTRNYYAKLGYILDGPYVSKSLLDTWRNVDVWLEQSCSKILANAASPVLCPALQLTHRVLALELGMKFSLDNVHDVDE